MTQDWSNDAENPAFIAAFFSVASLQTLFLDSLLFKSLNGIYK